MEKKIKIKIISDVYSGRKLKRKIGTVLEVSEIYGLHLCKHGIAEEVVKEPENKAEKFKKDTIKKTKKKPVKKDKFIKMVK